jgi:hypothetical protein
VNQRSYDKKINIFEENGELYKSYNIDDSYTDKYLDLINQNPESDTILTTNSLKEFFGNKSDIYGNTISESLFISDSVLVTIGILNYIINSKYRNIGYDMLSCNTVVLFRINIFTDIVDVIPLKFIDQKLYPQANSLEFVNNHFYFILFPMGQFKKIPNSPEEIIGRFNFNENIWSPILRLPNEYITSNINQGLDYNYKISSYKDETYFISPFTNYLFNSKNDTIWLSDLQDPIKFSLNTHNAIRIYDEQDLSKLDSLSHNIVDFSFLENQILVLLNKPVNYDGKVYLNKYSLSGKLIDSTIVHIGESLETIFISENRKKIIKVYMENEDWWVEEININ